MNPEDWNWLPWDEVQVEVERSPRRTEGSRWQAAMQPRSAVSPSPMTNSWDQGMEPRTLVSLPPAPRRSGQPLGRLLGILGTIEGATEGQRNATLHWGACRVGEMVADGEIVDALEAARALSRAAEAAGLTSNEAAATIRSGFAKSAVKV